MLNKRLNPVRGVLSEEYDVVLRKIGVYKKALSSLPIGSLVMKKINSGAYYYLAKRIKKRVVFEYIGKMSPEELARWDGIKSKKAQYRRFLSDLREQEAFLKRVLHERKKHSS